MSDSEDETNRSEGFYKPSFVLIAVDASPSMFAKNGNSTPFKDALSACYDLADSLMLIEGSRSWNPFGVVLARDDDSASLVSFKDNIFDSIKLLKEKSSLSENDLKKLYQRKGIFDLSAFFLFCKKKFKEVKSTAYKRTFIYITNDDNPTGGDKPQRFAALNEAKNFVDNDIEFQMVTMNKLFDYKIFYNELLSVINSTLPEIIIEDREGLLDKLSALVVKYQQRKMRFYPFKNDDSRFFKVVQKRFIQTQKLYNNAQTTRDGKPIKKGAAEDKQSKSYKIKCTKALQLYFTESEHFDLKTNDLFVGYTLLYVGDRVTEVGLVLSDSVLLEIDSQEDLNLFNNFWQYCVDRSKVLICVKKSRPLDKIRFVEFIPKFANNTRMFLVKAIPFTTERKNPPTMLKLDKEGKPPKTIIQLIDGLTYDYHPKMFTNPSFAKKRAFLKSKFLNEKVEEIDDLTLDNGAIDFRLGEISETFKIEFDLKDDNPKKRKREYPAAAKAKKAK